MASGKGGTGKTLVATSLAASLDNVQLVDCDVEEPNAYLFFPDRELLERSECRVTVPVIDEEKCNRCGTCSRLCAHHALAVLPQTVLVFPELCHGCGLCVLACPEKAISEDTRSIGEIFRAKSGGTDLIWGELNLGEARTTPLIRAVKEKARGDLIVVNSPPGTSCSMVEAVRGSDFCLLVTEPTPFGLYDLDIALKVLEMMKIPQGILANKSGLGDEGVYDYAKKMKIPILMEIPMSRKIAGLYSRGIIFVLEMPQWRERFIKLFKDISEMVA
ncbi:MAG: ATP-binding protein [Methanotrichaceae archaeon]